MATYRQKILHPDDPQKVVREITTEVLYQIDDPVTIEEREAIVRSVEPGPDADHVIRTKWKPGGDAYVATREVIIPTY